MHILLFFLVYSESDSRPLWASDKDAHPERVRRSGRVEGLFSDAFSPSAIFTSLFTGPPLSQLLPSAPRFLTIFSFQFSIGYFQLSPLECADP
jgi:hypothetical protein